MNKQFNPNSIYLILLIISLASCANFKNQKVISNIKSSGNTTSLIIDLRRAIILVNTTTPFIFLNISRTNNGTVSLSDLKQYIDNNSNSYNLTLEEITGARNNSLPIVQPMSYFNSSSLNESDFENTLGNFYAIVAWNDANGDIFRGNPNMVEIVGLLSKVFRGAISIAGSKFDRVAGDNGQMNLEVFTKIDYKFRNDTYSKNRFDYFDRFNRGFLDRQTFIWYFIYGIFERAS